MADSLFENRTYLFEAVLALEQKHRGGGKTGQAGQLAVSVTENRFASLKQRIAFLETNCVPRQEDRR